MHKIIVYIRNETMNGKVCEHENLTVKMRICLRKSLDAVWNSGT